MKIVEGRRARLLRVAALLGLLLCAVAAPLPAQRREPPPIVGRWDITVETPKGESYPSWLDVELSGYRTLVGHFVSRGGSVRPISEVRFRDNRVEFSLPVQWERGRHGLYFEGRLEGDRLSGRHRTSDGEWFKWTATRAPALERREEPQWGAPIELFDGQYLSGWKPRNPNRPHGWVVQDGLLRNRVPLNDLVTTRDFTDFKLHAEFRYPQGSNSGIYLRGRYEVQIEDNYGQAPESHRIGGVYGFLTPRVNAAKPAGEWQTLDVTLVGRHVTVVLNGVEVIDRQEIPGITGGALDSREGEPGPIYIQGDHGPIDFRRITVTPAR